MTDTSPSICPLEPRNTVAASERRDLSFGAIPAIVAEAGAAASFAYDEYFNATIRSPRTRAAYGHGVRKFLAWVEAAGVALPRVTPGMVGAYFRDHAGSVATRKLDLAAVRGLFDLLVTRHAIPFNPALSVRGERHVVVDGKTPEIPVEQAKRLLASIRTHHADGLASVVGLRDKAILGVLTYTAARAGAVAKLRLRDLSSDGTQYSLRFEEKGGKSRDIPVRHDLQEMLLAYLAAAGPPLADRNAPLFRSLLGRTGTLSERGITGVDICRLVKRRLKDADLPLRLSPHSFRVTAVTDLLSQGVPIEDVQFLAGHSDLRTTRLYDRRQRKVTRNIVERISV